MSGEQNAMLSGEQSAILSAERSEELQGEAVPDAEAQDLEDQEAAGGESEDMRANDPACLLCDDGGGSGIHMLQAKQIDAPPIVHASWCTNSNSYLSFDT